MDADGGTTTIAPDAPDAGAPLTVAAGEHDHAARGLAGVPQTVTACNGAETYLYIDPTSKQIATGRESIVASWYASGGTFALDRIGRTATDTTPTVTTGGPRRPRRGPSTSGSFSVTRAVGSAGASYILDLPVE